MSRYRGALSISSGVMTASGDVAGAQAEPMTTRADTRCRRRMGDLEWMGLTLRSPRPDASVRLELEGRRGPRQPEFPVGHPLGQRPGVPADPVGQEDHRHLLV